jgi:LPXTG-motif cell wall-anchored protein
MTTLWFLIVGAGLLATSFLLGRKSRDNAYLDGYHLGRKVVMWRAPNIRFTGRALVPASRRD